MQKMFRHGYWVALIVLGLGLPAFAQVASLDYVGYGWEDGGFPPSDAGDVLNFVGVVTSGDLIFGLEPGVHETTIHLYDLVSTGGIDIGGGNTMFNYVGGMLDIYTDPTFNAAWGTLPPNATAPSTFNDGTLFFRGAFTSCVLFMTSAGGGSYEGTLNGISGTLIDDFCEDCVYTWGGAFTAGVDAQLPEGYDLQMDGIFEIDISVASETTSWDNMKALFRN